MKRKGKVNLLPFLPEGIISQIIKGLDLKSIIKSKLVCKRWRNLISDLISDNLLAKADILFYDALRRFGALDVETYQVASMNPILDMPLNVYIGQWSVNGLVCFMPPSYRDDIYICNPFLGEYISFPKVHFTVTIDHYALGFCPYNNEYMLTMIKSHSLEIYTIGGTPSGWRSVPFEFGTALRMYYRPAICVGGVLHWLLKTPSILTFDLAKEMFGTIPLPRLEDGKEVYQLEYMDHCLVVTAGYNPPSGLEIWVRKEEESSVWTKNWVIDAAPSLDQFDWRHLRPRKLSTDGCIIFVTQIGDLMSPYIYDPRNKLVKPYHWDNKFRAEKLAYNYSPTLVSPKKLVQKNGQEGSQSLPITTHQLSFLQRS